MCLSCTYGHLMNERKWANSQNQALDKKKKALSKALVLKCCTSAELIEKWSVILQACRDAEAEWGYHRCRKVIHCGKGQSVTLFGLE